MAEFSTIFAGFGGQGLLFAGKVMAYCALIEDKEVTWMPSYGPEMRGGTANCSVTISDRKIGSPLVLTPDAVVALNRPSFEKYLELVKPGGIIIADSSMLKEIPQRADISVYTLPASPMAEEAELKGLANILMLGKLHKLTNFCQEETVKQAIERAVPKKRSYLIPKNIEAFQIGRNA